MYDLSLQADLTQFDILDQRIQVVIDLFKNGFAHCLTFGLTPGITRRFQRSAEVNC